jgi:hypothetical protein
MDFMLMAEQVTNNTVPKVGMAATHSIYGNGHVIADGPGVCVVRTAALREIFTIFEVTYWSDWRFKVRTPELGDRLQGSTHVAPKHTVIALGDDTLVVRYDENKHELLELVLNNDGQWIDPWDNTTFTLVVD